MNLFRAMSETPELRDAILVATSALQQRADADLAVAANARSIEAAGIAIPELNSIATRLHAEAIKCEALASASGASRSDVNRAVKAADKAAIDLAEKKRESERATAARDVLVDMARNSDTAITLAKAAFTSALAAFREQPLGGLEDDLRSACAGRVPLSDVLAAALAVDIEFPGGLCTPLLDNLKIISPRNYRVSHDEIGRTRVDGTDLLSEAVVQATLPEEAALLLREIKGIVEALRRWRPFTMPKLSTLAAPPAPTRSPSEQRAFDAAAREQDERQRRYDEEVSQREERSREPYQTKSMVREPGTPAPAALQRSARTESYPADLGARSLDGNVSDEYGWLDDGQADLSQRGES